MRQWQDRIDVPTPGRGLAEITAAVERWVAATGVRTGVLTLFIRHTSASAPRSARPRTASLFCRGP